MFQFISFPIQWPLHCAAVVEKCSMSPGSTIDQWHEVGSARAPSHPTPTLTLWILFISPWLFSMHLPGKAASLMPASRSCWVCNAQKNCLLTRETKCSCGSRILPFWLSISWKNSIFRCWTCSCMEFLHVFMCSAQHCKGEVFFKDGETSSAVEMNFLGIRCLDIFRRCPLLHD